MIRCDVEGKDCTGAAVRTIHLRGRTGVRACPPCSHVVWVAEYRRHWDAGIAFDRGCPAEGYEWRYTPVPAPWGDDANDPRSEEERAASRKRRDEYPS